MLKIGQEQLFYLRCVSSSVLVTGIVMAAVHNDGYWCDVDYLWTHKLYMEYCCDVTSHKICLWGEGSRLLCDKFNRTNRHTEFGKGL